MMGGWMGRVRCAEWCGAAAEGAQLLHGSSPQGLGSFVAVVVVVLLALLALLVLILLILLTRWLVVVVLVY
jgi:hypothetical protein